MHSLVGSKAVRTMAFLVLAALLSLPSPARPSDDLTRESYKEFPLRSGGRFELKNHIGDVTVSAWDKETVGVRAVKEVSGDKFWKHGNLTAAGMLDSIDIRYETDSGRVRVETDLRDMQIEMREHGILSIFGMLFDLMRNGGININNMPVKVTYEVRAPRRCSLDLKTNIGEIRVEAVEGDQNLDSDMGSITTVRSAGNIHASLGMGEIDLGCLRGSVEAKTGMGEVSASLESLGPDESIALDSGMGEINLTLPAGAAVDLDAVCGMGSVENSLGGSFEGESESNSLCGKVNGGGTKINLKTGMGSIEIKNR